MIEACGRFTHDREHAVARAHGVVGSAFTPRRDDDRRVLLMRLISRSTAVCMLPLPLTGHHGWPLRAPACDEPRCLMFIDQGRTRAERRGGRDAYYLLLTRQLHRHLFDCAPTHDAEITAKSARAIRLATLRHRTSRSTRWRRLARARTDAASRNSRALIRMRSPRPGISRGTLTSEA